MEVSGNQDYTCILYCNIRQEIRSFELCSLGNFFFLQFCCKLHNLWKTFEFQRFFFKNLLMSKLCVVKSLKLLWSAKVTFQDPLNIQILHLLRSIVDQLLYTPKLCMLALQRIFFNLQQKMNVKRTVRSIDFHTYNINLFC